MSATLDITLDVAKFRDPEVTADGTPRARVGMDRLATLWFNTGTLCNITCANCYIDSSPTNDRLSYLTSADMAPYLDDIANLGLATSEIGFTGGEPFMNRHIIELLELSLGRRFRVLVLTNAMVPMWHHKAALLDLNQRYGEALTLRVSLDHYGAELHEAERGAGTFEPALGGLAWLSENGFTVHVAGRTRWDESEDRLRQGYGRLFAGRDIAVVADDPQSLVLFPEMDEAADVPEITTQCWDILGVSPGEMMCAISRMVIKRKGAGRPVVVPCTLLPYGKAFEMGHELEPALAPVALNHPHCARFCVLGGGSCSPA